MRGFAKRSRPSGGGVGCSTIAVRLLGLDMKLRQYGLGKRFADFVAARSGIIGLNAVWREPAALPGTDELESPDRWLARVSARLNKGGGGRGI